MIHVKLVEFTTAKSAAAILENPEKFAFSLAGDSFHGSMSCNVKR
jgi:hypothetical protein